MPKLGHLRQMQLLLHGAIVLFVGLLCGIPFAVAAGNAWGEEVVRAWRVAHTGGATVGLMLITIGAVLPRLMLADRAGAILVWSLVASAYSFTLGVLVAALAGVRGLKAAGPALNWAVFTANMVGTSGALLGVGLTIVGAYSALRAAGSH
jgi:hypothetical protein